MKNKIQGAKAFVGRHKVAIACATGATVGVLVTRKVDTRLFSNFAYQVGAQAGIMSVHLDMAFTFIEDKGLWDEYLQYGPKFVETATERVGDRVIEATESIIRAL